MTVKLGDGGGGEEGLKRLGKRAADEDALEGEGAGSGDAAEDSSGTKRDGKTPRGGRGGATPRSRRPRPRRPPAPRTSTTSFGPA
ncbi:Protein cramped-like protein [Pteropus alecto]|uniref:Protein cramped-like protein n=1 Tax=Pteropus alecto TaxID=9402 RepID=L5KJ71_PTEAL|nr:Protein cramped-like protein [Pteropus alecto]